MRLSGFTRKLFCKDKELSTKIKNILGYYPKNIYLYQLALRHKSVALEFTDGKKMSNERLEYLGDAILSSIVADYLFHKYPLKDEGFLTQMRSKLVSRVQLNNLAQKLGITRLIKVYQDSSNVYRSLGGDALEALIGAIYIDKGYSFTKAVIIDRIIKIHLDLDEIENKELNYKSKLIEYIQKEKLSLEFRVTGETGKGYTKQYIVTVFIDDNDYGTGTGFSIKTAEQNAAEIACSKLCPGDTKQ